MTYMGICKIKLLLNGKCFVSICADKSVYDPKSDEIVLSLVGVQNFLAMIIDQYPYNEFNKVMVPSIIKLGKPFTVKRSCLMMIADTMRDWDKRLVIEGNPYKLDEYRRIIKTA